MRRRAVTGGFTLLEVLVALAIVAVSLLAGLQATAALTHNGQRQSDLLLAQLCAENELVKMRLSRQIPGVGETSASCEQAGRRLTVRMTVLPTPNVNFRRVDAWVLVEQTPLLRLSTIVGRIG